MAETQKLSAARVVVLATDLCLKADYKSLATLQRLRPDVLAPELCCRVLLTFTPGNELPYEYLPFLKQLWGVGPQEPTGDAIDTSQVEDLSEAEARDHIRQLRLEHLAKLNNSGPGREDVIARFMVQQAYRIDAETGDLPAILELVEPFIDHSEFLRRWLISTLLPLLRLDYEYYSVGNSDIQLEDVQHLEVGTILDLLSKKEKDQDAQRQIGRDLRGIVGPFVSGARPSKRRKLNQGVHRASVNGWETSPSESSPWQDVNEWVFKTSIHNHNLAIRAVTEWGGPNDVDLGGYEGPASTPADESGDLTVRYAQAALAVLYAADASSTQSLTRCWQVRDRVMALASIDLPAHDKDKGMPESALQPQNILNIPRRALATETLLERNHALTWPSTESLKFLGAILKSLQIMSEDLHSQHSLSCRAATELCLFSTAQAQRLHLQKLLQNLAANPNPEIDWFFVRERALWLSCWQTEPAARSESQKDHRAIYWQVPRQEIEIDIFNSILTAKQYDAAISLYLTKKNSVPLSADVVEGLVEGQMLNAYDNASNGNRSRGGLKRASELLKAFGPYFPASSPINKMEHLLAATHSISFYHLTLQHGVPFQPVSIRVNRDPISLISKVLEQNQSAYTKLDDLLSIGRGFVAAGLPTHSPEADESQSPTTDEDTETKSLESDHRIIYDAIISALSAHDFDTAYSYILTRLSPSNSATTTSPPDDTSWRAAYAAGRHRPPQSSTPPSRPTQILILSKRLDLLSLALTLVPSPTHLPQMLTTWSACESELTALRAQEAEDEKAWDDRGDELTGGTAAVPGGFGPEDREDDMDETRRERERRRKAQLGRKGYEQDEAPMGLFDVARGAARAIGKSAFPLRATTQQGSGGGIQINQSATSSSSASARQITKPTTRSRTEEDHFDGEEGQQRVRKRDMVSNMVTSGLVGGLGWVLGAQPVEQEQEQDGDGSGDGEVLDAELPLVESDRDRDWDRDLLPRQKEPKLRQEPSGKGKGGAGAMKKQQEKGQEQEQDEWQDW